MKRIPEILAPAGGREQLIAAVRCGADAVYLGTKNFNARRNASNFASDELSETVSYCHARNVKVYVTLNTLLSDSELPAVLDEIKAIAESGADAAIVQDLAAAKLFRECSPDIELHASTQMTLHNSAGLLAAASLGFRRAVLARELSLEEIKSIRASIPDDFDLEVFVHGALCVSVSGACYLSSMIGGRSGNRGLCAGPCRLDFRNGDRPYSLSLKDMSFVSHIQELADAGVSSLKIEGRMKRPEYVAAAVTACRESLEGKTPDIQKLRDIFSRGGFTDGYLTGKIGISMYGHRGKEDVAASDASLSSFTGLYRRERSSVPVNMKLSVSESGSKLDADDGINSISAYSDRIPLSTEGKFDPAELEKHLSKTGGTPFYLTSLSIDNPGELFIAPSVLNSLRRDALDKLLEKRSEIAPHKFTAHEIPGENTHISPKIPEYWVRVHNIRQLGQTDGASRYIVNADEITADLVKKYGGKLTASLPALSFENEAKSLAGLLSRLSRMGVTSVLCENIGTIQLAEPYGFCLYGGFGLNIYNSAALLEYNRLGLSASLLSFELSASKIADLKKCMPVGAVGYGRLPLMRLRSCPIRKVSGCPSPCIDPSLKDRLGKVFPIMCENKRYSTLLNSVPLYIGDKQFPPLDFIMLDFTLESPEETGMIFRLFTEGAAPDFERTNGLYFRETK